MNINKGEFISIMGQNGAGKTTLIRTLNGLLKPSNGLIYIGGEDISHKTTANLSKRVGIIFQNPMHQLFSNTVKDEIKFSLNNLGLDKEEIEEKIEKILQKFNFLKYKDRSPLNLSGGESKKLAIASIVCRDPEIIVFDEPTLGQDSKEIEFFIDLVNQELEKGKTIIMVTHNVEFTIDYVPRTILMAQGKIIADGPTNLILANELILNESSLIKPIIYQLKSALNTIGLNVPDEIFKQTDMTDFLINYLNKYSKVKGE